MKQKELERRLLVIDRQFGYIMNKLDNLEKEIILLQNKRGEKMSEQEVEKEKSPEEGSKEPESEDKTEDKTEETSEEDSE